MMGNIDAVSIDVAIYCNKVTATKLLQQSHCKVTSPLFLISNSVLLVFRVNSSNLIFL